ncbi:MAG TPA: flagellar filament capping protein FliD [Gaiellales bacterium]|jgi:flagellar hook-associated protein 2|nr:flagellar filament capping protein FliD [Gaiellales bacterium]
MTASISSQSISGLASGLDTASIISALMTVEQRPQARIQQKLVVEQARQQALKDVLSQLGSLTTAYRSITDPAAWADTQTITSTDDAHVSAVRTAGAAAGAYSIAISQLARANQYAASGATTAAADDVLHLTVGGATTDVAITAGDTLDAIASKIQGVSNTPVYASVVGGQLVISNRVTGTANAISSITTNGTSGLSFGETQAAQDAAFTIDGVAHSSGSNVVSDAIVGTTLTLKGQTSSPATITIGTPSVDSSALQQKMTAFVTQYNTTIGFILGKLDENAVASPRNDADRAKGVLNGDSALVGLLSTLRNAFGDLMGGRPPGLQSLAQVGLSTGATTGTGALNTDAIDGKLAFDSGRFSTALAKNFNDVKALFTNPTGSYGSEGLAQRLNGVLGPWTAGSSSNGLLNTRIDGESATIASLQTEAAAWTPRLAIKEQMLKAQFAAMETALSQAQSQSAWLDGQIAQLPTH